MHEPNRSTCVRPRRWLRLGLAPAMILAASWLAPTAHAQFAASDEYQAVGYEGEARSNPVARLQASLENGEQSLEFGEQRGYFDALLSVLDIDPDSQTLVFSPTSLQDELISAATPRGLYFNDDTYLGYVQNSSIVEVATLDDELGIVFYLFDNTIGTERYFERANQTCLVCHDTQGTTGGGVPMLMALSSVYNDRGVPLRNFSGTGNVGDRTPIEDRWGGWYVTGRHGLQAHLGNLMLRNSGELDTLDDVRVWNLDSLDGAGYFDTAAYPRDTSDIVALMVLEHQITVQSQISYIRFKVPAVLKRRGMEDALQAKTWRELPDDARKLLARMGDKLVGQLVFMDAATSSSRIAGSADFAEDFARRGPRDPSGRSLRDFDLDGRLFRYPLSYLIYTENFATMPAFMKDYVYRRLADYLGGKEVLQGTSQYSIAERRAALDILTATEPDFLLYCD